MPRRSIAARLCVAGLVTSLAACPWLDAGEVARLWRNYTTQNDPRAWSRVWTVAMLVAFANRRPV